MSIQYNIVNKDLYISLITKKLSSELNTAELKNLNSWLNASKDNAIVLQDFKNVWAATAGYKSDISFDTNTAFQSFAEKINLNPSNSYSSDVSLFGSIGKIVTATVAIIGTAVLLYFYIVGMSSADLVSNSNMHAMTVTLNEYSDVTLAPESQFNRVASTADLNTINIEANSQKKNLVSFASQTEFDKIDIDENYLLKDFEGQGYFDLRNIHQSSPYIIHINDRTKIASFDASFNVQNYKNENIFLDVQSGTVLLSALNKVYQIGEGERLIYDQSTATVSKVRTPNNDPFKWHKGILAFNNTPLKEVFKSIEKFYGVDITVTDNSPTNGHYTVSNMKPSSLNECLELLHTTFEMDIKRKGLRQIEISNIKAE